MTALTPSLTPGPNPPGEMHKFACVLCTRRKVKCDKGDPCSYCFKTQSQCFYEASAPYRPRKRAADEDLLVRLAQYEDLMRRNNVDFSQYANTWISCGPELQQGLKGSQASISPVPPVPHPDSPIKYTPIDTSRNIERCLWSNLSPELKYPHLQRLAHQDGPLCHAAPSLQSLFDSNQPSLHDIHPEPRSIFKLWQSFVDNINPFIKIIHVPTLQQRILDASWDLSNASKSLAALLFSIYTLSISLMSTEECHTTFGEHKNILRVRYRNAAVRALIDAEVLTTRDLEVMQAFTLCLLGDPGSDLTSTLTGAAIKLCQKMGMDQECGSTNPNIPFFEKEMRIRLWWQLRSLDYRCRAAATQGTRPPPLQVSELGHVRLPLNVNDADLCPDMSEPPTEHIGPTEMMCVLMKLEVFNNLRSSPTAAKVYDNIIRGSIRDRTAMTPESEVINELEARLEQKFFRSYDKTIPLHTLTRSFASLTIARMRFKVHHPRRRQAEPGGGEVHITREESDLLFNSALAVLEMAHMGTRTKFSSHVFTHMTFGFQIDAYIYVLSDLRQRCSGDQVALAWKLVEVLFDDHPQLIDETENKFYYALGDLALEAWETRRKELLRSHGRREPDITPPFIRLLWDKREIGHNNREKVTPRPMQYEANGLMSVDGTILDWECWDDFFSL